MKVVMTIARLVTSRVYIEPLISSRDPERAERQPWKKLIKEQTSSMFLTKKKSLQVEGDTDAGTTNVSVNLWRA